MFNLVCIICREELSESDDVYSTQCGHIFHRSCISNWLNSSDTCPQCRETCDQNSIHKLYLESAVGSTTGGHDDENQPSTENILVQDVALDILEEVNFNLNRELEIVQDKLDESNARLLYLEDEHEQVQSALEEETERRSFAELENSIIQDRLKEEIRLRKIYERKVAQLEYDRFSSNDSESDD